MPMSPCLHQENRTNEPRGRIESQCTVSNYGKFRYFVHSRWEKYCDRVSVGLSVCSHISTRSSAIAEGPRDALFQLKSFQLLHN